jgi:predicted Ser/Thr protein kinase
MSPFPEPADCPLDAQLQRFATGKLPLDELETVGRHLEECTRCAESLSRLESQPDPLILELRDCLRDSSLAQRTTRTGGLNDSVAVVIPRNAPRPEETIGELGAYDLVAELGRGGMGVVYKGYQPGLDRIVAVKTLLGVHLASREAVQRFRTEAQAIGRLQHPHIVQVYEYGEADERPYLCMEYVPGKTLAEALAGRRPSPHESVELLKKIAAAVQYAHQQRVLHRDLKPSNVLIGAEGEVKLTDFGLAKFTDDDSGHTHTQDAIGTASYMAPEQVDRQRGPISERTDVYGLGAMLYEMLAGRPPFRGKSRPETLQLVATAEPAPLPTTRRLASRHLNAICLKCLAKDPGERYASVAELLLDLERWERGDPVLAQRSAWRMSRRTRRRASLVTLAVALLLVVGGTLYARSGTFKQSQLRGQLARGETAILLGERGPPGWFDFAYGGDRSSTSLGKDGAFYVSTWDQCCLRLLTDPGQSDYVFSAEIRHERSDLPGEVGLFLALQEQAGDGFRDFELIKIGFNDVRSNQEIGNAMAKFAGPPPEIPNAAQAFARFVRQPATGKIVERQSSLGRPVTFKPAGAAGGPWRKLEMRITSTAISASWDGRPLAPFTLEKARGAFETLQAKLPAAGPAPSRRADPARGGLGVYLFRGAASFRNIVLRPL